MIARALLALVAWIACGQAVTDPLPVGLTSDHDLRGVYRAALCGRPDMPAADCETALRTYAGEVPAPRPPAAPAARYRLVFVPGFMASCFPGIHTFGDAADAARSVGYAVDVVDVGGRNGIAANARFLAEHLERTPADGRRIILVAHSKGADDSLQMLATRPDLAARVDALLTVSGALQGSPLADDLHFVYGVTFGVLPFESCDRGEGDAVADLQPQARRLWWQRMGSSLRTPIYSIVSLPDFDRLSPSLVLPYLTLSRVAPDNDGMLPVHSQVVPSARLLGVVNADHLKVAIPHPGVMWLLAFSPAYFPRPQVVLAAVDVIAAQQP
ncbi:MAG TPA: hypothetical protein VMN56_03605 [Casimicrobiaceae bacterium]|nr:hypothetical protein [Casimicrobiaceae bacterium]